MTPITLFLTLLCAAPASTPSADDVVQSLMLHEMHRQGASHGYTAMRRYTLDNKNRHASMLVRLTVSPDGTKHFDVVEEAGSGSIRKYVFRKMLDEEANASRPAARALARLTPENYTFQVAGVEMLNGRSAYVLEVTPKAESKYLIAGKVWVDATDYAMARVEGKPAKNPSMWTRNVHFVHVYGKSGEAWLPRSNHSVTEVRVFGRTEMTIEYFDYLPATIETSMSGGQP